MTGRTFDVASPDERASCSAIALPDARSRHRCGRLEHDKLAPLLAACTAQVVPSTFPEAFGMVEAEAEVAAAGVLPIVAAHSGLDDLAATLGAGLPPEACDLLRFEIGP